MPRVAVIDDDVSVRNAFGLILTSAGFEAMVFDSVESFMESRVSADWDCIVTDLRMPSATGFDLLERLHAQGSFPPVIVVTAFADAVHRKRARRLGVKAFFSKPIDDQALVDAIHWAIEDDARLHRYHQKLI